MSIDPLQPWLRGWSPEHVHALRAQDWSHEGWVWKAICIYARRHKIARFWVHGSAPLLGLAIDSYRYEEAMRRQRPGRRATH